MFVFNKQLMSSFFLISFIVFGPVFVLSGVRIDFRIFIVLTVLMVFILHSMNKGNYKFNCKGIISIIFIQLFIIFIYTLFIYLNLNDTYMLNLSLRLIVFFILTLFIVEIYLKKDYINKYFFNILFYATALNSIVVLLMAKVDFIRLFIQKFQLQIKLLEVSGNIRMMALNGMAGSTLSFLIFIGGIAYFYMESKNKKIDLFLFMLILWSLLYAGRTGLIFFIVFLGIKLLFHLINKYGLFISTIIFSITIPMVLLASSIFNDNLYLFSRETINTFRFLSSMYISESGLPITMENLLYHSFFLPENNIWFGSIGFNDYDGGPYHSDIGYIKMIFSIGIIGQILFSILYITLALISYYHLKYEKSFSYTIIIIIFLFLFHLKGLALGSTLFTFIIFLSFFSALYKQKQNKLKEK